ncbi:MAG: molybdopterin-dependent oxidoreductase, partial [Steroidobacteraceae bacterium]|nr:molybdopterin-dependent oxidoreductase [Steroidobacteraceae bacterium]MDW8259527.1 aldehyde oxidase [Gammaproteobacteria bacterium]
MTLTHVTRRQVLQGGTALSGGLLLGFNLAGCDGKPAAVVQGPPRHVPLNAWLHIGTDDTVRFLCDRAEMGQGVYTALPMLLAEELMVKVDRIQVEFAPAGQAYVNDLLGTQITGGSTSIRDAWQKLRTAGAQAREMLIAAACRQWGIGTGGVRVEDGVVVSPRGKRLSYGAVADAAAKLPVPEKPPRRARVSYKVIGQERGRLDTPAKVDGSAVFGIDVKLDGMLYAALAQPPVLGGKLRAFDAGKAKAMRGVRDVIATSSGVVV